MAEDRPVTCDPLVHMHRYVFYFSDLLKGQAVLDTP